MPTISELTALSALSKLDKFEVERAADSTSYSVTAADIANYVKNTANGGFRGSTAKALNDFTIEDIGVWHWANSSSNPTGVYEGILEIKSYAGPDDDNSDNVLYATLVATDQSRFGASTFARYKVGATWGNWAALTNRNGCQIEYGIGTAASVTFGNSFNSVPAIIAVPAINSASYIYNVSVGTYSQTGFTVNMWKSCKETVKETTTETTTESGGTTTKTTTIVVERGEWEAVTPSQNEPFFWIALSDA